MNYFSLFWKSYLVLFSTFITALRFYAAPLVQKAGVRTNGFWFAENPGKIRGNLGKISENLHKIPENLSKRLKIWAKMAPNGAQNNIQNFFFVGHFFMEFFGQVTKNSGKDHLHPQNFACSYSYVLHHHRFRDLLECFGTVLGIFGVAFVRALLLTQHAHFVYTHSSYTFLYKLYNVLL